MPEDSSGLSQTAGYELEKGIDSLGPEIGIEVIEEIVAS